MRKLFDWIRDTKEARIALAICAGLLLYRFMVAILSTMREWFRDREMRETIAGWGVIFLFVGLCVWLWRSQRRKTLGVIALVVVGLAARISYVIIHERKNAVAPVTLDFSKAERVTPQSVNGIETPLAPPLQPEQKPDAYAQLLKLKKKAGRSPNVLHLQQEQVQQTADSQKAKTQK